MRLIDADALTATLGITDMDCNRCAWHDREWSRCKRGSDFEDACCAIENAPTIEERKTGEWIPCSERLPVEGIVLVTYRDRDIDILRYPTAYRQYDIIAWMPIEPWKGEEHETD